METPENSKKPFRTAFKAAISKVNAKLSAARNPYYMYLALQETYIVVDDEISKYISDELIKGVPYPYEVDDLYKLRKLTERNMNSLLPEALRIQKAMLNSFVIDSPQIFEI